METDKIINHEYKSVTSRILQMKAMQHHIFENMKFEVDSSLLRFDCLPRLQPTITMKEIYYRDTTSTWVWILYDKKSKQSCVLKIFKIPDFSKDEKDKLGMHYQLEVRFLRLFSYMARNHVSPHVVLPIGHTIFHSKDVQDIVGQKYKVVDNNYMVLLSECATSSLYSDILNDTLSPYHLKVLIFQVVYTIMCIQDVFPSFRHNDLHLSNVLTQEFKQLQHGATDLYEWTDTDRAFIDLKRAPRRALLWDMHFSSVSKEDASKFNLQNDFIVPTEWVHTRHCNNNYYDMHKFFDSLDYVLSLKKKEQFSEERTLIDTVVPTHLRCLSTNRTKDEKKQMRLWEQCIIRPIEILQLPYFKELYQTPPKYKLIKKYCPVSVRSVVRLDVPATK